MQTPVQIVDPGMVRTGDKPSGSGAFEQLVATVLADVVEGAQLAVGAANRDDASILDVGDQVAARLAQRLLVAQELPASSKDLLALDFKIGRVDVAVRADRGGPGGDGVIALARMLELLVRQSRHHHVSPALRMWGSRPRPVEWDRGRGHPLPRQLPTGVSGTHDWVPTPVGGRSFRPPHASLELACWAPGRGPNPGRILGGVPQITIKSSSPCANALHDARMTLPHEAFNRAQRAPVPPTPCGGHFLRNNSPFLHALRLHADHEMLVRTTFLAVRLLPSIRTR